MYRWWISIIAVVLASCGFADLRPIEVRTSPGKLDTVLAEAYSPLSVMFNTGMVRTEAENLLLVSSAAGMVEGDRFWNGNTLVFVPVAGWVAGTRYVLGLSGIARSVDGREIRLERTVSFFAMNRLAPPRIAWHSPADGESVHANGLCMEMHFSRSMNRVSVETSLSVEGMPVRKYEWSDDSTILKLIPERSLSPWTVYRWTLRAEAKCADGVPLAMAVSAMFSTDLDHLMPEVSGVYPVLQSGNRWIPTGGSLESGFGPGLAIAVEFNKPMPDAAFRSLRFEPSLAGRTDRLSEKSMVFIPSRDPEPETAYTLVISGDAQDTEGLKIGSDYRRVFVADIPYLQVLSINIAHDTGINPLDSQVVQIPASESDGGLVRFTIHFSQGFSEDAKQKTVLAISLLPFFPGSLDPIALRFVSWHSNDRLSMEWERLKAGSPDEPHYYRLFIPGGRGGVDNGGGMYLRQDITLFMEAVK